MMQELKNKKSFETTGDKPRIKAGFWKKHGPKLIPYLMIFPAFSMVMLFIVYPVLTTVVFKMGKQRPLLGKITHIF